MQLLPIHVGFRDSYSPICIMYLLCMRLYFLHSVASAFTFGRIWLFTRTPLLLDVGLRSVCGQENSLWLSLSSVYNLYEKLALIA
jgi:hypothetical protein